MMNFADRTDTICAPATIPGTGAVSMIRVSGPGAFEIVDRTVVFRKGSAAESKGGRVKFACVYKDGELLDEVLVSIFRAPHSYTGEDSAEISCHASAYIVSELLALLCKEGCRLANPGEFTQRAFINGKMDLTQAEAVADVISSNTEASHRVALRQLKGGFSGELSELRSRLLEMASLMELELDFSEEDVEFADRGRLCSLLDQVLGKIESLRSSFRLGNAIKNGVPVAIVGAANAGKSTLLNAILGEQRAIVSDIAGTTRDTIEECFNVDGVLFRFVDTAGIRNSSSDSIESIGIQRSFESMKKARIILVVIDSAAPDFESLEAISQHIDFARQKVVFVLNKSDIEAKNGGIDGIEGINKNVTDINTIVSLIKFKGFGAECVPIQEKQAEIGEGNQDCASETGKTGCLGHKCVHDMTKQVKISAKTGEGVSELLSLLSAMEKSELSRASEESVLITNMRHYQALTTAGAELGKVRSGINEGSPTDLLAEDLRSALSTLGSITGEISTQDVLNNIFRNFCIGK